MILFRCQSPNVLNNNPINTFDSFKIIFFLLSFISFQENIKEELGVSEAKDIHVLVIGISFLSIVHTHLSENPLM